MAAPNEVRVNIRHNVLLLKTFTVPQLQAITGLNRHSIHSEVRRMKEEKLVSEVGIEKRKKGTAGGRPPVIYQLTSDPKKRFEVLQSVRAFYLAAEEQVSEPPRPESKHYFIAKEMLEEMIQRGTALTQDKKAERLDVIKKRLEYARREEEVGEEGTQLIAASFHVLEAKAIDTLAGEWEPAIKLLDEARKVCQRHGANDLVAEVNSYVQTIVHRMAKAQREYYDKHVYDKVEEITRKLGIIKHRFGDLPEVSACIEGTEWLAQKGHEQQISTRAEEKVEEKLRHLQVLADSLSRTQTGLLRQMPGRVEEQRGISQAGLELQSALTPTLSYQSWQDVLERSPYRLQSFAQLADVTPQPLKSVQERND
jgi:predicted ArsR family transcriptional regulator